MSWLLLVLGGLAWIIVVGGTLVVSLVTAANSDFADARGLGNTAVVAISGAIFAVPGVIMIVYGLRRRTPRSP